MLQLLQLLAASAPQQDASSPERSCNVCAPAHSLPPTPPHRRLQNHKTVHMITANTVPLGFTGAVYAWFFVFVCFCAYFTIDTITLMRLIYLQTGSLRRCFKFWWNWIMGEGGP
jgi:hypothetical protein